MLFPERLKVSLESNCVRKVLFLAIYGQIKLVNNLEAIWVEGSITLGSAIPTSSHQQQQRLQI
jgi:hypothetical protein